MELKSDGGGEGEGQRSTFNRTILELKSFAVCFFCYLAHTFNRTILELKSVSDFTAGMDRVSFNRTILELKLMRELVATQKKLLLIGPYWN